MLGLAGFQVEVSNVVVMTAMILLNQIALKLSGKAGIILRRRTKRHERL